MLCVRAKAMTYSIVIGTDYNSLYNLCIGDTLKFMGDSTNQNVFGTITCNIYNNQTQNYHNFTITSFTNIATTYDHILAYGDSSFYYDLMPYDPLLNGGLFFNCLTTNATGSVATNKFRLYNNPSKESFYLMMDESEFNKVKEMKLYSVDGRLQKQLALQREQSISELPDGIYFINLQLKDGSLFNVKLVAQR